MVNVRISLSSKISSDTQDGNAVGNNSLQIILYGIPPVGVVIWVKITIALGTRDHTLLLMPVFLYVSDHSTEYIHDTGPCARCFQRKGCAV